MLRAYYRRLTGDDPAEQLICARAWSGWEAATSNLRMAAGSPGRVQSDEFALALARIEAHYFVHRGFLGRPNQLLEEVARIRSIPSVIVQGRYDVVCPPCSAWDLWQAWPESELRIVPDAGHSAFEPGIVHELIEATDRFAGQAG